MVACFEISGLLREVRPELAAGGLLHQVGDADRARIVALSQTVDRACVLGLALVLDELLLRLDRLDLDLDADDGLEHGGAARFVHLAAGPGLLGQQLALEIGRKSGRRGRASRSRASAWPCPPDARMCRSKSAPGWARRT